MEVDKTAMAKSVVITTSSTIIFSVFGLPILFELVLVCVLTTLLRKKVLDNEALHKLLKEQVLAKGKGKANEGFEALKSMVSKTSSSTA